MTTLQCGGKSTRSFLSVQAAPGSVVDTYTHDDGSGRQIWVIAPLAEGWCSIRSAEPGREWELAAENAEVILRPPAAEPHRWRVTDTGGGRLTIQSEGGGFLSAHADFWDDLVDLWTEVGPEGRQVWASTPQAAGRKTQVPPEAAARLRASVGLTEMQIDAIQSLVACPENSTTNWPKAYGFAKWLGDGRGMTFGLVGFCSGTGDGVLVLEGTARRQPGHRLARYVAAMRKTRGESRTGLAGLEEAVRASGADTAFREAQWEVASKLYWEFAAAYCQKRGKCAARPGPVLRSALAVGAMFDTALNHGGELSSFKHITDRMRSQEGDEGTWLKNFCEARRALLKSGYADLDTSGTGDRASIWVKLVDERNWDLARPIDVAKGYWGRQRIA